MPPDATSPTPAADQRLSWAQTLRVYLEPASLRMFALGFSAGLPLLQEMVRNLVDNAMAYGGPKGVVTARVLVDRFSGVQLVQVEDNGPGIPASERGLVMQPFYRALGTDVDGSGLGLAIVQEIAQQHGATVHMEDAHPERARPGLRVSVRFVAKQALGE